MQRGLRGTDLAEQKHAGGLAEDHVALAKPAGEEGNLATTLSLLANCCDMSSQELANMVSS